MAGEYEWRRLVYKYWWSNYSNTDTTAVTIGMNNNQYRCIISSSCGTGITSNPALLTVNSSATITAQPSNAAVCIGANASFSVTATGGTGYQWQVSTNGGGLFTDIAELHPQR
jgi:hypothetical protein